MARFLKNYAVTVCMALLNLQFSSDAVRSSDDIYDQHDLTPFQERNVPAEPPLDLTWFVPPKLVKFFGRDVISAAFGGPTMPPVQRTMSRTRKIAIGGSIIGGILVAAIGIGLGVYFSRQSLKSKPEPSHVEPAWTQLDRRVRMDILRKQQERKSVEGRVSMDSSLLGDVFEVGSVDFVIFNKSSAFSKALFEIPVFEIPHADVGKVQNDTFYKIIDLAADEYFVPD